MPTKAEILGFSNDWYAPSLAVAVERPLPSRIVIRAVPPPHLLATKIEAFRGRGRGDYLASPDFGDAITLIDGRPEVPPERASQARASTVRLRIDQIIAAGENPPTS